MNFFRKLFKKRKQPVSSDEFKVVLKTNKNLSEEQKSTIIQVVKNGILSGSELNDIAINIMTSTGIFDMIIINRIDNGVEVIF